MKHLKLYENFDSEDLKNQNEIGYIQGMDYKKMSSNFSSSFKLYKELINKEPGIINLDYKIYSDRIIFNFNSAHYIIFSESLPTIDNDGDESVEKWYHTIIIENGSKNESDESFEMIKTFLSGISTNNKFHIPLN